MLKAVIDTNVWISALLKGGKPRVVIDHFEIGFFTLYYPKELIDELEKIQLKAKLALRIQSNDVTALVELIQTQGHQIEIKHVPARSRDPKDDVFLACAAFAQADFLVTGDDDLLCLREHARAQIVTPAQFIDILASADQ